MNLEFIEALNEIERDKGVSKDAIFEALESALISSYKKNFGTAENVEVEMNRDTGEISLFALKEVVDEVFDPLLEISLQDAQKMNGAYRIGDVYRQKLEPANFGRIAAQTAKQVVIQRIKDAERDVIFEDFTDRENEIITGDVQRVSKNNVFFDLGKTEAILPPAEQMKGEHYVQGQRMKLLLLEVRRTSKGPQVVLSRSHPNLVRRLFELEVPEISQGIVEIFSIAREAGSRTKIAVFSREEDVDPLGACVGFKGARVRSIVEELHNEKIDIVIWEKDIAKFIANALSPSKVVDVFINEGEKSALVVVPDFQLSLAIGKEGQNARLAAKLTSWKVDIKSETQFHDYLNENGLTSEELRALYEIDTDADDDIDPNTIDFESVFPEVIHEEEAIAEETESLEELLDASMEGSETGDAFDLYEEEDVLAAFEDGEDA